MEKNILVRAITLVIVISIIFFFIISQPTPSVDNIDYGSSNFYRCFDVQSKVSMVENDIIYGGKRCSFRTENVSGSNLTFSTETEGSITMKNKLVLNNACQMITEEITGFELINPEKDGLYLSENGTLFYCAEIEYRV